MTQPFIKFMLLNNIHFMDDLKHCQSPHSCLLVLPSSLMSTSCCKIEIDVTPLLPHDMPRSSLPGRLHFFHVALLQRPHSTSSLLQVIRHLDFAISAHPSIVTSVGHWSTLLRHIWLLVNSTSPFCSTFNRHLWSNCFKHGTY